MDASDSLASSPARLLLVAFDGEHSRPDKAA